MLLLDDAELLYETFVTPEELATARLHKLPDNFHAQSKGNTFLGEFDLTETPPTAGKSPILSGLLKTPSFVPPAATLFGKPAAIPRRPSQGHYYLHFLVFVLNIQNLQNLKEMQRNFACTVLFLIKLGWSFLVLK